jgi:hypothetical protein
MTEDKKVKMPNELDGKTLISKVLRKKDCEAGESIVREYDEIARKYRDVCVAVCEIGDLILAQYYKVSAIEGLFDKFKAGEKIEGEDFALVHQFEQLSIQKVEVEKARVLMLNKLNSLKKERNILSQKLFKRYGLNKTKTYYFDFSKQAIYEMDEENKPNQTIDNPSKS